MARSINQIGSVIGRVSVLTLLTLGLSLGMSARRQVQADPTDDLSFFFTQSPLSGSFRLMSSHKVMTILRDHMKGLPESEAPLLANHLLALCRRFRFDPAFILSLIQVESRFKADVVSSAGAVGLMQLKPATAAYIANRYQLAFDGGSSLKDPYINLAVGVAYLSYLRTRYKEFSPYFHVAAYNMGPAKMDSLMAQKSFRPVKTMKYYDDIRHGVPEIRFYAGRKGTL